MKDISKGKVDWAYLRRKPLLWLYSAYLTLRYVDKWNVFPAIKFNGFVGVKFRKGSHSFLGIKSQLIFEQWLNGNEITTIQLGANSCFEIDNEFLIGNGVKISLSEHAKLYVKGKKIESASGITANSIILVNKYVEIGYDCLIAWDVFITDCDWHQIISQEHTKSTIIGDHVWIGAGSKILKGSIIKNDVIVASQAVVLQGMYESKTLIGGIPAKQIKDNIPNWSREINNI